MANQNKSVYLKHRFSKSGEKTLIKVQEAQERFEQLADRKELDTMGQVIMKHHKKMQTMKKKEKENKSTQEYFLGKK